MRESVSTDYQDQVDRDDIDYRGLFDLSLDMLCVAGTDGYFKRLNPAFEAALGWTQEEMLAKPIFDFVHEEDRNSTREALQALARGERVIDFVNRYLHRDGTYRWFQWRAVPADEAKFGEVVFAVGRDVTAAREQEEERRHLEEKIQQAQKLESLGLLAGGVAHDFNNLLSGILGHTELALLDLAPNSPIRDDIELVKTTTVRAAELCQQMLAYSGKGRLVIRHFQLSELIGEMVQLLEVSISKNVRLCLDFSEDMPPIEGDTSQIQQVVMNLIINAAEAIGDQSGTISVTTGVIDAGDQTLSGSPFESQLQANRYAFFEVIDSGQGMDHETQARIFDPFFTTKFTGRGLGLAAVLGIVRGHGGVIRLDSRPGRGTHFKILLPVSERPAPKPGDPRTAKTYRGHGKVLLADDDETVRNVVRSLLISLGFEVVAASDGEECLVEFDRHGAQFRLVVLDLTMPRLDGEAAFRELRRRKAGVPVLMTSGHDRRDLADRLADTGLTTFLQKPYSLCELEDKLRELIPEP